ncbi:MAG: hypothetical protein M9887_08435 [Chitinophagales bacterium]|nr:hypothetical protein [Chitinophagales bacterium]
MSVILPDNAQKILDRQQIELKIDRMAYEILELNHKAQKIVLLGIEEGGFFLAKLLMGKIKSIKDIELEISSIKVNKTAPYQNTPSIKGKVTDFQNLPIVLIDDVGNSGLTLFQALQTLYDLTPISVHVALLIDRTHKKFPIDADIVGLDMATTLSEHIHVVFNKSGKPEGVYVY